VEWECGGYSGGRGATAVGEENSAIRYPGGPRTKSSMIDFGVRVAAGTALNKKKRGNEKATRGT